MAIRRCARRSTRRSRTWRRQASCRRRARRRCGLRRSCSRSHPAEATGGYGSATPARTPTRPSSARRQGHRTPAHSSFSAAYHGGTIGSMAVSGHSAQAGVDQGGRGSRWCPTPIRIDPSGATLLATRSSTCRNSLRNDVTAGEDCRVRSRADPGGRRSDRAASRVLRRVRSISVPATRHPVVCDEVKVGLGRTGQDARLRARGFRARHSHLRQGPRGGLPISAAIGPAESWTAAPPLRCRPCMATRSRPAGARRARNHRAEGLAGRADRRGDERLREVAQGSAWIGDVRGRGLAIGVED